MSTKIDKRFETVRIFTDTKAFLYSLDHKVKMKVKVPENAIQTYKNYI